MTILINAILVIAILILIWPIPLRRTLKYFVPLAAALAVTLTAALILNMSGSRTVTVTALKEKNQSSDGSEIWIRSVTVNGVEYQPENVFDGVWVSEEGYLKWRDYDQPEGMTDHVTAVFPAGSDVDIAFQTNKWRGKAEIIDSGVIERRYTVDCYSGTSDKEALSNYSSLRNFEGFSFSGETAKRLIYVGAITLALSSAAWFAYLYARKKGLTERAGGKWRRVPKIAAAALAAAVVLLGAFYVLYQLQSRTVTVTAQNSRNPSSEGSEIWIESVVVNGVRKSPQEVFSSGWISEKGFYIWRDYDKPEGMTDSVSAVFPRNSDVDIIFQTNKWRGQAQIKEGDKISLLYDIDTYSRGDGQEETVSYQVLKRFGGLRVSGGLFLGTFLALICAGAVLFTAFGRKKEDIRHDQRPREVWLDLLKVICAPLIVLLHTAGVPYGGISPGDGRWPGYLILNAIPRCGVPIFIMISGALLIGREYSKEKVKGSVKKGLAVLVVWNVFYIIAQALLYGPSESILKEILSLPVNPGPSGHLWYTYFLVWMYLLSPIISSFYKNISDKMRISFVALTVLVPGVLDLYLNLFDLSGVSTLYSFQIYMTLNYVGMMFIGRLIYERVGRTKKNAAFSLLAAVAGLCGLAAVSFVYSKMSGSATDKFMPETKLFPVCYGAGVLSLAAVFRGSFERLPVRLKNIIDRLSRYSLGIYLIHSINLWCMGEVNLGFMRLSAFNGPMQVLALCVLYYALSVAEVVLIAKIRPLKKLVA